MVDNKISESNRRKRNEQDVDWSHIRPSVLGVEKNCHWKDVGHETDAETDQTFKFHTFGLLDFEAFVLHNPNRFVDGFVYKFTHDL